MRKKPMLKVLCAATLAATGASASAQSAPSRGELLYTTHCVACHNTQLHWRERRQATDWDTLKAQVRHWQARVLLDWDEADVIEVTRHLNDTIYRFPQTGDHRS